MEKSCKGSQEAVTMVGSGGRKVRVGGNDTERQAGNGLRRVFEDLVRSLGFVLIAVGRS